MASSFFSIKDCCFACVAFKFHLPKNVVQSVINSKRILRNLIIYKDDLQNEFPDLTAEECNLLKLVFEKINCVDIPVIHNYYYEHTTLEISRKIPGISLPEGGLNRGRIYQVYYSNDTLDDFQQFLYCVFSLHEERHGLDIKYDNLENTLQETLVFITDINQETNQPAGIMTNEFKNVHIENLNSRESDVGNNIRNLRTDSVKVIVFNRLIDRFYNSDIPSSQPWLQFIQEIFQDFSSNLTIIFGINRSDYRGISPYFPITTAVNFGIPNRWRQDIIILNLNDRDENGNVHGRFLLTEGDSIEEE